MAADRTAGLAALQQKWEASGDMEALLGALAFYQELLPDWLFKGLWNNAGPKLTDPHEMRFLAVRHAHDALGMTLAEAYEWAFDTITNPRAKGGPDSMMKSYQKFRRRVPQMDRIQPRPRARRRRR
jgi:hypothetical protein